MVFMQKNNTYEITITGGKRNENYDTKVKQLASQFQPILKN